jgi:hypothetical protein
MMWHLDLLFSFLFRQVFLGGYGWTRTPWANKSSASNHSQDLGRPPGQARPQAKLCCGLFSDLHQLSLGKTRIGQGVNLIIFLFLFLFLLISAKCTIEVEGLNPVLALNARTTVVV